MIRNVERAINEKELSSETVKELIGNPNDAINAKISDEAKKSEEIIRYYEDETERGRIVDDYPERWGRYFDEEYDRAKKSQELTDKLGEGVMEQWKK